MKLGLGAVQFGLDYGISNQEGQTLPEEVIKILEVAGRGGIRVIDTASLYGTSEETLGTALSDSQSFSIVTKTPQFKKDRITPGDAQLLEDTFYQSLSKLRQSSLYGLLIHNADDLLTENGQFLIDRMVALKGRGLVEKIGVSVYTAEHIDRVIEKYRVDLVQLPVNVFDQRLINSGHLQKLRDLGVEVHARSAFLQGLLLMEPDHIPSYFNAIKEHFQTYHKAISRMGLSPVQAALGFVMGLDEIDSVICGVNNHRQLQEICSDVKPLAKEQFTEFAITNTSIINPSEWRIAG
ncbi:MAG: aldo/keto reductase [Candidatus Aquicultor sp.]